MEKENIKNNEIEGNQSLTDSELEMVSGGHWDPNHHNKCKICGYITAEYGNNSICNHIIKKHNFDWKHSFTDYYTVLD